MKNKILLTLSLSLFCAVIIGYFLKDEEISIILSTGKVVKGNFIRSSGQEPRRVATIKLKESYITWKKYLDGNPRNKIHFDAALPLLQPNEEYKKDAEGSDFETHRQWVKISLGLYGFSNQLCDKPCSRREHNQKTLEYNLNRYEKIDPKNAIKGLTKRISGSSSYAVLGRELYVPRIDHDINYIECQRKTGRYRWCKTTSYLNENMHLGYQFEYVHLNRWQEIDQKIRLLTGQILVEHREL
jgi:hypothetical protein